MDFEITSESSERAAIEPDAVPPNAKSGFVISATPVVAGRKSGAHEATSELPKSKGNEPLYLLPRDPTSAYAFWNLDWSIVLGEPAPREREVLLKMAKAGHAEAKRIPVQPTAGSCLVEGLEAETTYRASLGYYDLAGYWVLLAASTGVTTPAADIAELADDDDFATVPFHLSFQRMLELLRVPKQESQSLAVMLNELRARDESAAAQDARGGPDELVDAIRQAVAQDPPPKGASSIAELWTPQLIAQVIGGLRGSASPQNGFGGSSRAA